jgi:hypothetical protein
MVPLARRGEGGDNTVRPHSSLGYLTPTAFASPGSNASIASHPLARAGFLLCQSPRALRGASAAAAGLEVAICAHCLQTHFWPKNDVLTRKFSNCHAGLVTLGQDGIMAAVSERYRTISKRYCRYGFECLEWARRTDDPKVAQ